MVTIGGESPNLIDPLADYSSISLFPRSFPPLPGSGSSVGGSVYSNLKSMVLRNPENLLKQAKTVLDDSVNLFKNDKTSSMASKDKTDAVSVTNEMNHRVRRPGLGLEPAKFSMKPMPKQMDTITEPTFDIDKYEDPLEFFEAYERMENAKKEMRKLRGEPLKEFDPNITYLPPRTRRPGILGTRATYTHQTFTSKATDDSDNMLFSSEKTFVNPTESPVRQNLQSETDDAVKSPNTKVQDSTTAESKKDGDLNKLLSDDCDELDAVEVINRMHETLISKVQNLGKLSIPDFRDVRPCKSACSIEAFPKITDSTSHLNGIRKTIHGNVQPSKSPLASMSLLNRHISKLAPSMDTFSATDMELSLDAAVEMNGSHRSLVNAEERSAVHRRVLSVNGIAHSNGAEHQLAEVDQSSQVGTAEQSQDIHKSKVQMEENGDINVGQLDWMEGTMNFPEIVKSPENFNDRVADDWIDFANKDEDPAFEGEQKENEVLKDDSVGEKLNIENFMEKSTVIEVEGCESGQASHTDNILSKEPTKKTRGAKRKGRGTKSKVSTQASPANETENQEIDTNTVDPIQSPNKKRKQTVDAPVTIKKKNNRRSSLFGVAGSKWSGGVRRSSRIKMRPLEFWKGERFIYGRIHESLSTVIGVKYASPEKEAKEPRLKVKSFVSDELKDLLEHAEFY